MAAPLAIAFGGSILAPPEPEGAFLAQVARILVRISEDRPVFVSVGGGAPARVSIRTARGEGVKEDRLDRIGIQATRLNAQMMACIIESVGGDVNMSIPASVRGALTQARRHRIIVMGGTTPGHSTDYVAAKLATEGGASRLIIATSVDGVYTADPRQVPDAERIASLDFERLGQIIGSSRWQQAGAPGVVDGPATRFLRKVRLETCVVHGTDLPALEAAAMGRPFHGSVIRD